MDLEQSSFNFKLKDDLRRRLEEPLPVSLEAVADVHVSIERSTRQQLDLLYITILQFARVDSPITAYRSDNFTIYFDQPIQDHRSDYRPIRIIVQSLTSLESMLVETEIEHTRGKGLSPGTQAIILRDIEGNWLEIRERREIG